MSKIHFFNDPQIESGQASQGDLNNEILTPPCVAYICGSDGCSAKNTEIDEILNLSQFTV